MSVPVVRVSVEFKCDENEPPLLAERQPTYTAALAKCGVERTERSGVNDRGPTFCLRRRPPQEPPEGKRLPGAEGPPEGKRAYKAVDITGKGGTCPQLVRRNGVLVEQASQPLMPGRQTPDPTERETDKRDLKNK